MNKKLHIYIRVSTKEQKDNNTSLETQRTIGEELSEKLGIEFQLWDEGSQSSFKDDLDNRGVLLELLSEVDKGNVKKLYVWNTDRLSRNQKVWGLIRYKLTQSNVKLFVGSDTNPIDLTDPMDSLLVGLLSEISSYDNKIRMERFRLGRINRVKKGFWYGGPTPFGYEIENKKLVPNEYESKWINFIFKEYSNGVSLNNIRKELFKNGVKSRRGNVNWSLGSLQRLFKNTHYNGYYTMTDKKSGEVIEVECNQIISPSLYKSCQKLFKERSYKKGIGRVGGSNSKRDYLLKGVLECGDCGSMFGGTTYSVQYIYHYHCLRKQTNWRDEQTPKHKECKKGRRGMRVELCDDLIWNKVIDVVENSVLFKEEEKQKILEIENINFKENKEEFKKLQTKNSNIEKELKFISDSIVELETDKILKKRTQKEVDSIIKNLEEHKRVKVREQKDNLKLIEGNKKDNNWIDWVDEFGSKMSKIRNENNLDIRKRFLNGLVDRIIVNYDGSNIHKLRLFFKIPYVNDELIWKDKTNKNLGYNIKKGLKSLYLTYKEEGQKKTELKEVG